MLAGALAGAAHAGSGLLIGVADDTLKWSDKTTAQRALVYTRDLGVRAVRVTVPWQPGQTQLSVIDRQPVDRMILATWGGGLRVVLAVYGRPDDAPQNDAQRAAYCQFVAGLLHRYPGVSDVVIWNEPNSSRFWRPQFAPDGTSLAPAAYEALLARCWDVLHAARPGVNVIAASAPRGNDNPAASSNVSHSPVNFYLKLGDAYRAGGRRLPIFDTVGHNPYPVTNAERPWTRHTTGKTIAEGDYDKLMALLQQSFGGTGQPLPGQKQVRIWYMEQGFQTSVDPVKRPLYRGVETVRQVLPSFFALAAARDDRRAGARPGNAAVRRAPRRVLPARRRRLLQLRARRRAEPGRLAVRAALDRPDAEAVVRAVQGRRPGRRRRAGRLRALRQAVRGDGRRAGLHDTPEAEGSPRVK